MAALCSTSRHYILPLWSAKAESLGIIKAGFHSLDGFFFFFFLAYSQWCRRLDVYHTSTHDVALVQI